MRGRGWAGPPSSPREKEGGAPPGPRGSGSHETGGSVSRPYAPRPCLSFPVPHITAQQDRRGTAVAATTVRVAPHKAGGAAGRKQPDPSPWRAQPCPPQLAQEWGFPRPHSSEVRQSHGPCPPPTLCPLLSNAPDKGPGTRGRPGHWLPMTWGAWEPPSKRPPWGKRRGCVQ